MPIPGKPEVVGRQVVQVLTSGSLNSPRAQNSVAVPFTESGGRNEMCAMVSPTERPW